MGEKVSWKCAVIIMAVMLALSCCEEPSEGESYEELQWKKNKACDEIYVVGEGETLQTISEKCGDPFIVEHNPHIHDPDDVFPGLLIKVTPFNYI
ncbi:transcription initiation factor TFIID subunit 12-like [Hibiscus syriacus]|uniref:Transcription initiation factor TFIID subunit 12-like n=2 Tax=Hibiscus syriacus TaxID=106335 RepID=A0A6A2ZEX3_HIBSY|nr:transcription initiation factor TFIID subunit 12-like [Hibiscus syriacus]